MKRFATIAAIIGILALGGCDRNQPATGAQQPKAAAPAQKVASEVAAFDKTPANTWVRRLETGPNYTWEGDIAYDPATHQVAWYGGHAGFSYPQSNYTFLYDLKTNSWRDTAPPLKPQRRCLVMLNYIDSAGKMLCSQGSSEHGSIPEGGPSADFTKIVKSDPRGPWLYDVARDQWENCRTLPPVWQREAHAQCGYDMRTDSLVYITGQAVPATQPGGKAGKVAKLGVYCPRTNIFEFRNLPKELHGRLGYGIAGDPVHGEIVIFGGSGPGGLNWVPGDKAKAYETMIHNDTWIYTPATDTWKQVTTSKLTPPKGMPMFDHRFIPMVYHDPSGTIIMQQTPIDKYDEDTTKWPATQFWSFHVGTGQWALLDTKNTPPYPGLMTYAKAEDQLVIVGGGKDGGLVGNDEGKKIYRPSLSKQLWTCKLDIPTSKVSGEEKPPVSMQPWHPSGLIASVESAKKVVLTWNANSEKDIAGYNVYRFKGPEFTTGKSTKLTAWPISGKTFTDKKVDMSDNVACVYYVTAVNKRGVESGPSPVAYTFPDPALSLKVTPSADGKSLTVTWDYPKQAKVMGFLVYHVNNHMNTHEVPPAKVKAWFDSWKPVTEKPIDGHSVTFQIPADDNSPHHYFYVRAVNVLGQEGFYTDICSATDKRFKP